MDNANNTIDITNLSDAALDVVLSSRCGDAIDCEHLTNGERREVATALGWELNAYTLLWIQNAY